MKILYLSCHIVLEYDELRILNQLGHDVTVIGGYIDPRTPHVDTRPPLNIIPNQDRVDKIHKLHSDNMNLGIAPENCSNTLTKEVVDDYDVIYIMHRIDWVEKNWEIIKNKIVIIRTIGQNLENDELKIQEYTKKGLKVLRYSPKERELKNYAGENGLIRFLKYETDFKPRNIINDTVISFGQSVKMRGNSCGSSLMEKLSKEISFKLYGPNNQECGFSGGRISYDEQLNELATNACYFYTGTFPAQYTLNFIEALMSGIPIVSIGKNLSQKLVRNYPFEVPYLLDEINGFYGDDIIDIKNKLQLLIDYKKLNEDVSLKQKELAKKLFSVEHNINLWKEFLENL